MPTRTFDSNDRVTRDRILDAADACIAKYGVTKTTVDDILKRANVARATLYKHIPGGRDEIVLEVLLREARRNASAVLDAIDQADSLEDAMTDGLLAGFDRIREDEHLAYLFTPEIIGVASKFPTAGAAMVDATADVVAPLIRAGKTTGQVADHVNERDAAEWCIRTLLSLLTFEGPLDRSRDELREYVKRYAIAPMLA